MVAIKFELKKYIYSRWFVIVLLLSLGLTGTFFFVEYNEHQTVIPQMLEDTEEIYQQIGMEEQMLRELEPQRYQEIIEKDKEVFTKMYQRLESVMIAIENRNGEEYINASLDYYRQLPIFRESIDDTAYHYYTSEKESIYYLQSLKVADQPFEDQQTSLYLPNYLYQMILFLSNPLVFVLLVGTSLFHFGRERDEHTDLFMISALPKRRSYFFGSQMVSSLSILLSLALILLFSAVVSFFFGKPLFDSGNISFDWVVDSTFLYQTVVEVGHAVTLFCVMSVPLVLLMTTWYFLLNQLFGTMVFVQGSYVVSTLFIAFIFRRIQLIGNPFRFFDFKQFLYQEPANMDLLITWIISLLSTGLLFFATLQFSQRLIKKVKV